MYSRENVSLDDHSTGTSSGEAGSLDDHGVPE